MNLSEKLLLLSPHMRQFHCERIALYNKLEIDYRDLLFMSDILKHNILHTMDGHILNISFKNCDHQYSSKEEIKNIDDYLFFYSPYDRNRIILYEDDGETIESSLNLTIFSKTPYTLKQLISLENW